MTIVSMIAFQAKINEVTELEDGLKQYVSRAKQVGSTMALIRATTGPMGLFWTLTLYETLGEMASTREKIVASNAGTAFQNALTHVSAPPNFSLWRQLQAVDTTSLATVLNGVLLTAQKGKTPEFIEAVANLLKLDKDLGHNSGSLLSASGHMGTIILLTRCVDSDEYQSVMETRLSNDTFRAAWRNMIGFAEGPAHIQLGSIVTAMRD